MLKYLFLVISKCFSDFEVNPFTRLNNALENMNLILLGSTASMRQHFIRLLKARLCPYSYTYHSKVIILSSDVVL